MGGEGWMGGRGEGGWGLGVRVCWGWVGVRVDGVCEITSLMYIVILFYFFSIVYIRN